MGQEELVPVTESTAAITETATAMDSAVGMFERLATNPDVDVAKLERLISMQERILDRQAKAAFDTAFSEMQPEIPEIDEHGAIKNRDGQVQSRYARNEDIQEALRPILRKHGFSLSFRTEWPDKSTIRVVGILSHRNGFSRESEFLASADSSGSKNAIQALGSSVSYGHRYTTKDLLNITSRYKADRDDDGGQSEAYKAPAAPTGYEAFVERLRAAAMQGNKAVFACWNQAPVTLRTYMTTHQLRTWEELRGVAKQAGQ